jgi:hypothetical protein
MPEFSLQTPITSLLTRQNAKHILNITYSGEDGSRPMFCRYFVRQDSL